MSASLVMTALIVVLVSFLSFLLSILIYKKTEGGSKAYLFWAYGATFTLFGAIMGFLASFFMDPNKTKLEGYEGVVAIVQLSLYLFGYFYISLGAMTLPADVKITNLDIKKTLG